MLPGTKALGDAQLCDGGPAYRWFGLTVWETPAGRYPPSGPLLALYESKWNNGLDRALLRWMWKLYLKTSYMKYGKREMIKRLKRTDVVYSREKEAEGRHDNSEQVNS